MLVRLDHFPNFQGENKKYLKQQLLSMKSWLVNMDPYVMGYEIIPI